MSYAIVFSSKTGNTALLAQTLQEQLPQADCCYFGAPDAAALAADTLYVGFWTDKGKADGSLTEDSIAYTVKCRADNAVNRFNRQIRRSSFVKTQIIPREGGDYSVVMALDDEMGNLMTLELLAPNQRQAVRLGKLFEKKAEAVYNLTMAELLDDEDEADD